ncbi:MAG: protein-disulfide reductase DsbD family protein [Microscillaceae bacterium]|nr:protein-disulfide reductase DsbD family protein [Microscillaceae bacterium]MDW8459730.1 cytochrome c biogenesis protein CcdA [Cytophagales bacterium]
MRLSYFALDIFFIISLIFNSLAQAQIQKRVAWQVSISPQEVKLGETIEITFTAQIDKNWYLYSSDFSPNLGPTVTTFEFKPNDSYMLVGSIRPINPQKKYDDIFEGEYTYFKNKGEFKQTVKILKPSPQIQVIVRYQVCSDVTGQCIPGEDELEIPTIRVTAIKSEKPTTEKTFDNLKDTIKSNNTKIEKNTEAITTTQIATSTSTKKKEKTDKSNNKNLNTGASMSLWAFVLQAFLAGLVALFTPCVFPIIPMTVSFFTKQSGTRAEGFWKAVVYGISIVLIYTLLGTLVTVLFGAGIQNWLSTHWLPNLFFFLLLLFFAFSFLGMFELVLPSSFVNKIGAQADRGGYYGIFFMAFTLALVSFSCTAPIVGTVLIQSSQGEVFRPVVGMLAFSTALALPFSLFAAFPSWLKSLPKSGSWLNSVKVVLGFLELALALKFLSQIDLVYHLRILDREIFLALWIVIFSFLGFYLLGKIQLPHDSKLEKIPVPRLILAIATFTFVVYLIPGMWGAPLKALSGYLPPQTTFDAWYISGQVGSVNSANISSQNNLGVKYANLFKLPHNLRGFFDIKEAQEYAKKVNKPIFIDFTGHGCANCREMETRVWSDKAVLRRLQNDFVIVALYVDDRTDLPENEQYVSSYDNKRKTTIGSKNLDFQMSKFNANAQPYYCLVDADLNLLTEPQQYDLSIENFVQFLDKGKKNYQTRIAKLSQK